MLFSEPGTSTPWLPQAAWLAEFALADHVRLEFKLLAPSVEVLVYDVVRDYWDEARQIAGQLVTGGRVREGEALAEAIDGASTGSELCMALRHHLRKLAVDQRIHVALREDARKLAEHIDVVFSS